MASASGLAAGTRIALIGQFDMQQPLPLPILGVLGNAAVLSNLETAHLYEPMEPAGLLQDHLGLTLPWRGYIHDAAFYSAPAEAMAALRSIGVQAALSDNTAATRIRGTKAYKDRLGRVTYVIPVKDALPWQFPDAGAGRVQRMADGRLRANGGTMPPELLSSRKIRWSERPGGIWIGNPIVLASHWVLGTIMLTLASLWLTVRRRRGAPKHQPGSP